MLFPNMVFHFWNEIIKTRQNIFLKTLPFKISYQQILVGFVCC